MAIAEISPSRAGEPRHRLRPRRRHIAWALTLAGTVFCAACEPGPASTPPASVPPSTPTASAAITGPTLAGTVAISGAATIPTTTFVTAAQMQTGDHQATPPPGTRCTDYSRGFAGSSASGAGSGFAAPIIQTTGFHNIYVEVTIANGYRGPGTYTLQNTPSMAGVAVEGIGTGSAAVYTIFKAADGGRATLVVRPDGSGSLQIDHWDSDEVRQGPGASQVYILGTMAWTCRD